MAASQDSRRMRGSLKGVSRPGVGTCIPSLLPHSTGQRKSQGQSRFKEWENRLHLLMGGASNSHYRGCGYRDAMNWVIDVIDP